MDASQLKNLNLAGLYLAPPHGELIWEGRKKTIIRPDEVTLRGQYILVSGRKAYGIVSIGSMSVVPVTQFDDLFSSHRVTTKERYRWWPDAQVLFSHDIMNFDRCDTLVPVVVPSGVGMLMGKVEYGTRRTKGGGDTMPYNSLADANPAIRGIKPPVTLAQANLIASWADRIPEDDVKSPWAVAIAQFKKVYRVEGGKWVKKSKAALKEVLDATNEGDVVILRGAKGEGDEEPVEVPEATLVEETPSEPETAPAEETTDEVVQEEATQSETTEAVEEVTEEPPAEEEVAEEEQVVEEPLAETTEAVTEPAGEEPVQDKSTWTTAQINNFPDSSFLYVEPDGKKDEGGKTVPRSKRHFPVKDASGKADLPHVRNALSRLGQSGTGKGWLTASLRNQLRAKAQRMLAGAQGKEFVKGLLESITGSVKAYLNVSDEPELSFVGPVALVKHKATGEPLLITRTTNAFKDREGEIFSTQSLHDYVERHRSDEVKGALRYRHLKGSDFGNTIFQGVSGRFLIEVHKFHDTPAGHAMKSVFEQYPTGHPVVCPEGWGVSHGFQFTEHDIENGVYKRFEKIETSVLPAHVAANPYTNVEVVTMNDQAKQEFSALVGDEAATQIDAGAEQETKRLEEAGVEHKEIDQTLIESIVSETVKQVGETYKLGELSTSWDAMTKQITEIGERLATVEKGEDERLKEAVEEMPNYGWSHPFRASQAEETVTHKASIAPPGVKSLKETAEGMAGVMMPGGA